MTPWLDVTQDMELIQFDVKTAFLNSPIEEEIYMQQPVGYDDRSGRVCRLKKGLYGLKQAPRNWNGQFKKFIELQGFSQSESDPCVFIKDVNTENCIIVTLYVNTRWSCC
ncbi:hypothetical protein KPH14_007640 [Odynerus spinipes]|uniref:Reverse transcriptase Ty1/copia-type domain-containing protein n=1 Tax=Odynerus spinipes TaxID=1348599 RepID=A0AAD9RHT7_9HYME|nr:hypothetical protein KPH14_007640 [Odynerus spinipes]